MIMLESEATRRMIAARAALVLDYPFWGALALKLRLLEDPSCKSAWVDGRTLGFNPTYVMSLVFAQVKALWAHEAAHCAFGHPWRRGNRDSDRWNEAGDRAINPVLRDDGFDLPDNVLYELDDSHKGKSTEWIFNRLPPKPPSGSGGGSEDDDDEDEDQTADDSTQQPEASEDDGEGEGESDDTGDDSDEGDDSDSGSESSTEGDGSGDSDQSDEEEEDDGSGNGAAGEGEGEEEEQQDSKPDPFGGEVRDAPADADEEGDIPSEEDWKQSVQQAAAIAEGQGQLPAGADRAVDQISEPGVDWRSVTLRFAQEVAASDYSWVKPNRRYIAHGVYLPALHAESMGAMVVAIDTSASVDEVMISIFNGAFNEIVETVKPRCVYLIYCDAWIHSIERFDRDEPVVMEAKGGGGTSFVPVFETLDDLDDEPACLIYLTDLQGSFPQDDHGVPTLWVTPKRWSESFAPFGEIVPMPE